MIPGEMIFKDDKLVLNEGIKSIKVKVANNGDRAVQVGSHCHFFEVNRLLKFDRPAAFGYRLDIPSGSAVRFEPGEEKEVSLVEFGGNKRIFGTNDLTNGQINEMTKEAAIAKAKLKKFIE